MGNFLFDFIKAFFYILLFIIILMMVASLSAYFLPPLLSSVITASFTLALVWVIVERVTRPP